jgi:S1-C subfamily serine protease
MAIKVNCSCGKTLNVPETLMGKQGRCPSCTTVINIPSQVEVLPTLEQASKPQASFSPQDLFEYVIDSVVGILPEDGFGSGVIIDPNGIIATNRHVVGTNNNVIVRLNDGCEHEGEVIRSFRDIDLAFVKADHLAQINKYAEFAEGDKIKVGEPVYAVGHPLGLQNTLTRGIVSAVGRLIEGVQYIQTDASINPGNSGGPLFNEAAKLIGINTLILRESQGLGFAIPVDVVVERYQSTVNDIKNTYLKSYCGVCGNVSSNYNYCEHCGAEIESNTPVKSRPGSTGQKSRITRLKCKSCGAKTTRQDEYCPKCGATL